MSDSTRDPARGDQVHGTTGQKLRGATEVIHGVGDNLRGRIMDVVDSTAHGPHAAPHPETRQGTLEVERGMAKLTGGRGADAPSYPQADPVQQPSSQPQSHLEVQPQSRTRAGSELAPPGRGVRAPPSSPLQPRQQPSATLSGTRVAEHDFAREDTGAWGNSAHMDMDMGGMDRAGGQGPGAAPDRYAFESEPRRVG